MELLGSSRSYLRRLVVIVLDLDTSLTFLSFFSRNWLGIQQQTPEIVLDLVKKILHRGEISVHSRLELLKLFAIFLSVTLQRLDVQLQGLELQLRCGARISRACHVKAVRNHHHRGLGGWDELVTAAGTAACARLQWYTARSRNWNFTTL